MAAVGAQQVQRKLVDERKLFAAVRLLKTTNFWKLWNRTHAVAKGRRRFTGVAPRYCAFSSGLAGERHLPANGPDGEQIDKNDHTETVV